MRRILQIGSLVALSLVVACGAESDASDTSVDESHADENTDGPEAQGPEDNQPGDDDPTGNVTEGNNPSGSDPSGVNPTPVDVTADDPTDPDPASGPSDPGSDNPTPIDPCTEVIQCDLVCPEGSQNPIDENGCLLSCQCEPVTDPQEPEPAPVFDPEPIPPEDPCAEKPTCDLACAEGSAHPVDENGCIDSCSCEPVVTPNPAPICVVEGNPCFPTTVAVSIIAAPTNCCAGLSCIATTCTDSEPPSCSYSCVENGGAKDPCGGCEDGLTCIFQNGGPGPARHLCANETTPCNEDDLCGCIIDQGTCAYSLEENLCHCDNGLE